MEYTVEGKDGKEEVRLIITEEKTKNGTEIHPFITNREFSAEEVSENYGWRWRIETNNREFGKFRPFTTSQSMKLRRLLLPHRDVALQPMDFQARGWRVPESLPVQGFTKDRLEGS